MNLVLVVIPPSRDVGRLWEKRANDSLDLVKAEIDALMIMFAGPPTQKDPQGVIFFPS